MNFTCGYFAVGINAGKSLFLLFAKHSIPNDKAAEIGLVVQHQTENKEDEYVKSKKDAK